MTSPLSLGVCFHRELPARDVIAQAVAAEAAGFDEFWVIEDCFFTSGPSLAAAALTATSAITVGIGIMPAVARNAALTAMEIATLCGLAPGRFHAGLGHGMPDWMAQIGEQTASPVTALEESIVAVRRLLAGERLDLDGRYVQLSDVALAAPPTPIPLVSAGVRGPVSLAMAGRSADGVVLADFCSPTYVREVRRILSQHGGDGAAHRVTAFASMAVSADGDAMRQLMAPVAAGPFAAGYASITALEFYEELAAAAVRSTWTEALAAMPAAWWNQIGAIGTPDDAAAYLEAMADAGTDCIAMFPDPDDPIRSAARFLGDVRPLLEQ
jgi:alkanesulfonate monooxygenase SsuD/methylene tetrahydromethanopterin reductase-like flavin-dependent oxidoreductase (luciferase family)